MKISAPPSDAPTIAQPVAATTSVRCFELPATRRVRYGPGAADALAGELRALGCRRPIVVTTPSTAARNPAVERLRSALPGDAVWFSDARAHVPTGCVVAAVEAARGAGADAVISMGGGSAIDCAKAVALCAPGPRTAAEQLERLAIRRTDSGFSIPDPADPPLPHVAIPTTLSGAEFTSTFTVTNEQTAAKDMYHGAGLTPAVILLDGRVAQHTPAWLWSASGMRAIDHCVEFSISRGRTPFTDALLLGALTTLVADLEPTTTQRPDPDARQRLQVAAWMSCHGTMNVLGGVSHAIGHQLGSRTGVVHGHTSCIVLPHVLDFNRPAAVDGLARLAGAFGRSGPSPEQLSVAFVEDLRALILRLGLPTRLSEVSVDMSLLPAIAHATMGEVGLVNSPRPVHEADVLGILDAAR